MRHLSKTLAVTLIILLGLGSSNALAQSGEQVTVSQDDEVEAKFADYVAKGTDAFKNDDYKSAAKYFEKAFELKAVGVLLKNALVAWMKAGDCEEAARVAARLVAFVGSDDLSNRAGSEVSTVVDCALDRVDDYIADDDFDEARALLALASASEPNNSQQERIDNDWKKILELTSGDVPVSAATARPTNLPESFFTYAPWIAGGLIGTGLAAGSAGVVLVNQKPELYYPGVVLASFGAVSLVGGVVIMVLWLKPRTKQSGPVFSLYDNPEYTPGSGIKDIELLPSLSHSEAAASVRIRF